MFGTQAMRLLREKWKTPVQLAQELFAMFQDDIPLEHSAPVKLNQKGPGAALTINRGFGDGPVISIGRPGEDGKAGIGMDGSGLTLFGPQITLLYFGEDGKAQELKFPEDGSTNPTTNKITTSGGGIPGQVQSGAGSTYSVKVYPDGLAKPFKTVTVKQLQIHAAATIPAGTWAVVAKTGQGDSVTYSMQVPVWL